MNNALTIINKRKSDILKDVNPLVSNRELWFSCVKEHITSNDKILQASERDVISCVHKAMRDGLFLDGKEAVICTYRTQGGMKLTYVPMVVGVIKKMRLEGGVSNLIGKSVYENDDIDIWIDNDGQHIKHRYSLKGGRGKIIGAYAMATVDGERALEYLDEEQIDKRRQCSQSVKWAKTPADLQKTIWYQWPDQMYVKSAIHALKKFIPTVQNNSHILNDDRLEEPAENYTNQKGLDETIDTGIMIDADYERQTDEEVLVKQTFENFLGEPDYE